MHDMPESTARDLDKDSYSALTGKDPRAMAAHEPGEEGVEADVSEGRDAPSTLYQDAATTEEIARERVLSDGPGGQG